MSVGKAWWALEPWYVGVALGWGAVMIARVFIMPRAASRCTPFDTTQI